MTTLLLIDVMAPHRLWWLLVPVALLAVHLLFTLRDRTPAARSPLRRVVPGDRPWKRHVAVLASVASMVSLVIAYAQPRAMREVPRDRATVVVAMDVSFSMVATDVAPSRLSAAKTAATGFVEELPERFNVALVKFAASAQLVVPPTTDRGAVIRAIDALRTMPSTAIGDGIHTSLQALSLVPDDPAHPGRKPPAAIVLLSDGATNIGLPSLQEARKAGQEGVPIYTIAYGTPRGYVMEGGVRQPVPVNHYELAAVAKASGGEKFSAESKSELTDVYRSIASSVGKEKVYAEVTDRFVGIALLLAVVAALGAVSLAARWP